MRRRSTSQEDQGTVTSGVSSGWRAPLASAPARRLGHIPALDGLRGIAVIMVVVFHLHMLRPYQKRWLPGGELGVDLFFVLSGFLITSLLIGERSDQGRIRLGAFWLRRGLRLVPPLVLVLTASTIYALVEGVDATAQSNTAVATLFYFFNLILWRWSINADLGHLWSLSIEEQFYLVWPLVMLVLVARGAQVRVVVALIAGAAVLSTLRWLTLLDEGANPLQASARTDVRVAGLLIGCATGVLWSYGLLPRRGWLVPAAIAAWVMAVVVSSPPESAAWTRWERTVFSLASAVLIAAAAQGTVVLRSLLAFRPLTAVGRVSYGVYLWHLPCIYWVVRHSGLAYPNDRVAAALLLTVVATLFSWYVIERPCRRIARRRGGWVRPSDLRGSAPGQDRLLLAPSPTR